MKKIFYEKRGRRYVPTHEYDSDFIDSFPKGNHLVMSCPGGKSRRYNIDPNYAAMIAAGRVAEDIISKEIVRLSDLRPRKTLITIEQKKAWEKLSEAFGDEIHMLEWPSAREVAEKAVEAMMEEANKLMEHPEVKKAFDQFLLVASLVK